MSANSQQSRADKLRRVARPLKPEEPPFYVQHGGMRPDCLLAGWYWRPAGSPVAMVLGANYEQCLITLTRLATLHERQEALPA